VGLNEQNLQMKITKLSISQLVLSQVVGMSDSALSRGLAGTRPLAGPDIMRIDSILNDLLDIQRIIAPLALPSNDAATLRVLLGKYRDDGMPMLRNHETLLELRKEIAHLAKS
jgi:hypothetical protein